LIKTPFLIGIAGGSCSGKTLIAESLAGELRTEKTVVVLGLDSYYNDFTGVPHDQIEVDVPEALDKACLVDQLRSLSHGLAVERPVYDYVTHSRLRYGERVNSANVIIVEGLFVLFWPELRELLDLKVFIDIDHVTALSRRLERDVRDRGRTKESVLFQYQNKVAPNFERYVLPTLEYADILLDGTDPVGDLVEKIRAGLK
jgi:uridine kinase